MIRIAFGDVKAVLIISKILIDRPYISLTSKWNVLRFDSLRS